MIKDSLKNLELYRTVNPVLYEALCYLAHTDFTKMEQGIYYVDGERIYAIVQKYHTQPLQENQWEAHRKYIDLQYMVSGTEFFGVRDISGLKEVQAYDEEKDCVMFCGNGDVLRMESDDFIVVWPHEGHMPRRMVKDTQEVTKVVVKIRL